MDPQPSTARARQVITGLSFILVPLVFAFAFAAHPELLRPRLLGPEALILRARGQELLHLGHGLVTLVTVPLVVLALHFTRTLERTRAAWPGLIGGCIAVVGAVALAADKGALCLTMSALDGIGDADFELMMPGLLAIYGKEGWMALVWGIVLLPLGFAIQAVALWRTGLLPRWQSVPFLVGVLFVATPDGMEIVNLTASVLLAVAFVPLGLSLLREPPTVARQPDEEPLRRSA